MHLSKSINNIYSVLLQRLSIPLPPLLTFQQSLYELWIGFLNFYAAVFTEKTSVISIRQKAPLTKFEKLWMSRNFAIEDPFDLKHNLGGGLSGKSKSITSQKDVLKVILLYACPHRTGLSWLAGATVLRCCWTRSASSPGGSRTSGQTTGRLLSLQHACL